MAGTGPKERGEENGGKALQRSGYRLRGDRRRSGKTGAAEAGPEGRSGPSARANARAAGQGRDGGPDARSAEGTRYRDRRAEPEGVPRQGRAAGTEGGQGGGAGCGNGVGRGSVLGGRSTVERVGEEPGRAESGGAKRWLKKRQVEDEGRIATERTHARGRGAPSGRRRCAVRRSASRLRRSIRLATGGEGKGAAKAR